MVHDTPSSPSSPSSQVIAVNLPADEISGMREIFLEIDKDHSGSISAEEFAQALRKKGNNLPEADVMRLVRVRWPGGAFDDAGLSRVFVLLRRSSEGCDC